LKFERDEQKEMKMAASLEKAYEIQDLVGQGAFGSVRRVRRKSDGLVSIISAQPSWLFP
jgi:hypothetical protein